MAAHSETWTFLDGRWVDGNPAVAGPRSHGFWQGSSVFDGARYFEEVAPDLNRHAERVNRSAKAMSMKATMAPDEIVALAHEGARKFGPGAQLYIRPMYWAESEGMSAIAPDPESTRFLLCLYVAPLPPPTAGLSVTLSPFRRPSYEVAPTDGKSGCLYPNGARALIEARKRGFDNVLMLDMLGNVSETATSNIFMVRDGVVMTPIPNGTFLNGITRQRTIGLLRAEGREVVEAMLRYDDFLTADEIFITGNYAKTLPVIRIDDRDLQPGPVGRKTRELYWDFAHDKVA